MSSISILENAKFISICGGFHSDNLVWCHGNAGYKAAEKNRENFKLSGLVEFVHLKAEDYVVPDRADVFFFFHPFSEAALEKVLGNIEESYQRCRRRIRLIMYYMTAEYIKLMKNHPEYELISKTDCRDLFKNRDGRDFVFWYET